MRPVLVVVGAVNDEHVFEVTSTENQDPVETLGTNCAARVRLRRAVCLHMIASSYTNGRRIDGPDENELAVARYQGRRLARYAAAVAAREEGAFRVERPRPERFHAVALG